MSYWVSSGWLLTVLFSERSCWSEAALLDSILAGVSTGWLRSLSLMDPSIASPERWAIEFSSSSEYSDSSLWSENSWSKSCSFEFLKRYFCAKLTLSPALEYYLKEDR